jgi:hypothetical protein
MITHPFSFEDTSLGAFAKSRIATISFETSICLHKIFRLPLDGFLWNLIFEYFSKICRETSSFVKIWQIIGTLHEELWRFMIIYLWVHFRKARFSLVILIIFSDFSCFSLFFCIEEPKINTKPSRQSYIQAILSPSIIIWSYLFMISTPRELVLNDRMITDNKLKNDVEGTCLKELRKPPSSLRTSVSCLRNSLETFQIRYTRLQLYAETDNSCSGYRIFI